MCQTIASDSSINKNLKIHIANLPRYLILLPSLTIKGKLGNVMKINTKPKTHTC